jgi:hypothetical protein
MGGGCESYIPDTRACFSVITLFILPARRIRGKMAKWDARTFAGRLSACRGDVTVLKEWWMLRRIFRLVAIAIAATASTLSAANAQVAWAEYRPPGIGFALDMPGEWTATVQDINTAVGPVKGYMAMVTVGDHAYLSMYIPYPPDRVRGKQVTPILDGARNGAVANVKGTLRGEERVIVGNQPARQLIIDAPNDLVLVQKFFMLDVTLVQAVVVGHRGVETEPDTIHFLQSLKVVPP